MKKNIYYFLIPFLAILALKYFDSFSVSEQITSVESSEILISQKNIPETIDFNFHVKPIISDKCFACHGPDEKERAANLRLDTEDGLYQLTEELSSYVVDKKTPEKSPKNDFFRNFCTCHFLYKNSLCVQISWS